MSDRSKSSEAGGSGGDDPSDLLSKPIYNWLSVFGGLILVGSFTAGLFFFFIGSLASDETGYSGLTVVPPLILGVIGGGMMLGGYVRERRRQKRGRHSSFHRKWVLEPSSLIRGVSPFLIGVGIVAGTLVVLGGGAGSMVLVQYTESNAFCGETCHDVMSPEATVYQASPHSRIECVECHVGSGGDSYLNAKLNGLNQVYKVATGEIERPIPTPIHNRRASKDMCERCHTTDRLDEYKTISRSYFLADEDSARVKLRMLLKIGGSGSNGGHGGIGSTGGNGSTGGKGIHYHMMIANRVEYIARDPQRQDIAWVRVTEDDGSTREYMNEDDPLTDEQRETLDVRAMECLDCHSRPAHRFPSPVESVNAAMANGQISSGIPYIKAAAVTALDGGYESSEQARAGLGKRLRAYYEEEYPDELEEYSDELDRIVPVLREIYSATIFPEMKADWKAHPNNIGHRDSPGCFRCHNDAMVDDEGEAIFTDCFRCHAIMAQDEIIVEAARFDEGLSFVHPEDWDTIEDFTLCSDCHTGGADVYE